MTESGPVPCLRLVRPRPENPVLYPMLLNADLGESWYDHQVGDDNALMPHLDLCNVACGFHGGDALTMYRTIELAERHGVAIGAHPSFPDRKHFGRRTMKLEERLFTLLLYQVSALAGMVRTVSGRGLHHLKPHGALYHYANQHPQAARSTVRVMVELGIPTLIGPPRGTLREAAIVENSTYLAEGFVDRVYEPSLHLRSRRMEGACIDTVAGAVAQTELLVDGRVRAADGRLYPLRVDTLCIHGDHAGVAERAAAVRSILTATPPR